MTADIKKRSWREIPISPVGNVYGYSRNCEYGIMSSYIDKLIFKVVNAPVKRMKIEYVLGTSL